MSANNRFRNIKKLRHIDSALCGKYYSSEYAAQHKNGLKIYISDCAQHAVWIPEIINIVSDKDGNILYDTETYLSYYHERNEVFHTTKGDFISADHGEFGGTLTLPSGRKINGNFIEVFEFCNKIYAVDSLSHMSIRNTDIYENDDYSYKRIFHNRELSFNASFYTEKGAYLLISGTEETENSFVPKAELLCISENNLSVISFRNKNYQTARSMIIKGGKMILGMDKTVAVIDIESGQENYYTPLSEEDENALIKRTI